MNDMDFLAVVAAIIVMYGVTRALLHITELYTYNKKYKDEWEK